MSGMLKHLGRVAKARRRKREMKLVQIGAALDKSEGSLSRFEAGESWKQLEETVNAYAKELDVEPDELWEAALAEWRENSAGH